MMKPEPVTVFLSYAREDESLRSELEKHLSLLQRQGLVSTWHDRRITAGTNWAQEIDEHLKSASIILLLISSDFLASDYCYGIEMQRALERHEADQARVIPILMRPVDRKGAPFAHLQVLPTDAKAITTWSNQDEAFVDVVAGIRRIIEDLPFLAASASRALLPAIWNIPYPRNLFFTGRDDLLSRLHNQLQTGQSTALSQSPQAISGLGGIGKTQIALEYAYRYYQEYQAVLWAQAGTRENLTSSYLTIAALLNLPEKSEQESARVIAAIKNWLQRHTGWLLILDNADDLALAKEFLPPSLGGHVLLTTRAQAAGSFAHRLEIDTLSTEQGTLFLLHRAGLLPADATLEQASSQERDLALQITQALGELPLALDQAGAYMEETAISLQDYLSFHQRYQGRLLARRGTFVSDYPNSVATTWSLSFERIEKKDPAAAELLRLCAYLAPDDIAEEIITQGAPHLGPLLEPTATDAFQLGQAVEALRAYSLVRRNPAAKTLSIHRLVQAVLRDAMPTEIRREWTTRVIYAVSAVFPSVDFRTWQLCQRYLSQAQISREYIEKWNIVFPDGVKLLSRAGYYLWDRAQYQEAEPFYKQLLTIYEQELGNNHPKMISALNNLARIYHVQEKYSEAALLYQRALSLKEELSDSEDPELLSLLENYADLLRKTGQNQALATIEMRLRVAKHSQKDWLQ